MEVHAMWKGSISFDFVNVPIRMNADVLLMQTLFWPAVKSSRKHENRSVQGAGKSRIIVDE